MPALVSDALIQRLNALREGAGDVAPESHPEISKFAAELDVIWWGEISRMVAGAARSYPDRIFFTKDERLIIDAGVLDYRLIETADAIRPDLLRELYHQGDSNHFYFSQWLEKHYREFLVYGTVEKDAKEQEHKGKGKDSEPDGEIAKLRLTRQKIYTRLASLFQNLPGFPTKTVDMLISGRLDETLEAMSAQLDRQEDARMAAQRNQLAEIRSRMIAMARSRARNDTELSLFEALSKVDRTARDRKLQKDEEALRPSFDADERTRFLLRELKLVRNLLKLGVAGAGIVRTHHTLLSDRRRVTKSDLPPIVALVEECDPYLPGPPQIMIAPFVGTGFYEWDRNTIFVPLQATRPVDEVIVTALANYRLLLDGLHEKSALKKAYEKKFKSRDFRDEFTRDYRDWVLGIGKGFRGAMEKSRFEFFMKHIGPSVDYLYAPTELMQMSQEERRKLVRNTRTKILRAEGTWEDHYKLAACYFKETRTQDAAKELSQAIKMNPVEGRLLCALGHLASQHSSIERARVLYEDAIQLSPNTLWHVIAAEALQRI